MATERFAPPSPFFFFFLFAAYLIWVPSNNGVEASHVVYPQFQNLMASGVNQAYRTGYHFQPPRNWMNDPNGPMHYKGLYHLFYQYNPKGAVWGNIVWAHSVSLDLINWKALPPAIFPTNWFDVNGCWSGSATILNGNKPIIVYTGIDEKQRQIQNYAIPKNSSDVFLQQWIKPKDNPLIIPGPDVNASAFRDPTTAWIAGGRYWMLVGSRRKHRGVVYLYWSKDFKDWVQAAHPLHSQSNTGMWECPDFFPVSGDGDKGNGLDVSANGKQIKHVLKVSLDLTRFEYYTLGTYDHSSGRYLPDKNQVDGWGGKRFDYGNFYASKSFFDPSTRRRILWGWSNESDSVHDDKNKGWAGIQTIPRRILLDGNGKQLRLWPIEEVERLRRGIVHLENLHLQKGDVAEIKNITAAQADVEVTFSFANLDKAEPFDPKWSKFNNAQDVCAIRGSQVAGGVGPFGLLTLASDNLEEFTPVFFRIFKAKHQHVVLFCADARSSSRGRGLYKPSFAGFVDVELREKKLSLRSLIDHSVIESFAAEGRTVITSRVYPQKAVYGNAHLFVFNNGTEAVTVENLNAWSMKKSIKNIKMQV